MAARTRAGQDAIPLKDNDFGRIEYALAAEGVTIVRVDDPRGDQTVAELSTPAAGARSRRRLAARPDVPRLRQRHLDRGRHVRA
ncbi:MAG: hypothetical protein R2713_22675 [Ilumatobacteraceae bacterium]